MQKKKGTNMKEILSMEEYIRKLKLAKEKEKESIIWKEEKSPAWMVAELYG